MRAAFDADGALVVWWFLRDEATGEWSFDQGAKIPKRGLSALAELLIANI